MNTIINLKKSLPSVSTPQSLCELKATGKQANIYLYGVIGGNNQNTAATLAAQLRQYPKLDKIHVHLSTIGGSFAEGLPIYNVLRQHPASVTMSCMGYALSMGAVLLQAADRGQRRICANGIIMLHRAQSAMNGSAKQLRQQAHVMEVHEAAIIPRLMQVMQLERKAVEAILQAETWYSAEQALEAGLVDSITEAVDLDEIDQKMSNQAWQSAQHYQQPIRAFQTRLLQQIKQRHLPVLEQVQPPPTVSPVSNVLRLTSKPKYAINRRYERTLS